MTSVKFSYSSHNYSLDPWNHCRWSTNPDEPLLFVKYDLKLLDILDIEKKALILKSSLKIDQKSKNNRALFLVFFFQLEKKIKFIILFLNWCFLWFLLDLIFTFLECTYWVDVCQSDGNMLASGGTDGQVKIFDKRESKIVQTFDGIHTSNIFFA